MGTWLWEERGAVLPKPVCAGWLEHSSLQRRNVHVSSCSGGSWSQVCNSPQGTPALLGDICRSLGPLVWAVLCLGVAVLVPPPCCEYLRTARVQSQGAQGTQAPWTKGFATASVLLIPEACLDLISLYLSFLPLWWGWETFYTGECGLDSTAFIIILANAGMCEKPTAPALCAYSAWPGAVLISVWKL